MLRKSLLQTVALIIFLFANAVPALASTCGETITVQRGDTL